MKYRRRLARFLLKLGRKQIENVDSVDINPKHVNHRRNTPMDDAIKDV